MNLPELPTAIRRNEVRVIASSIDRRACLIATAAGYIRADHQRGCIVLSTALWMGGWDRQELPALKFAGGYYHLVRITHPVSATKVEADRWNMRVGDGYGRPRYTTAEKFDPIIAAAHAAAVDALITPEDFRDLRVQRAMDNLHRAKEGAAWAQGAVRRAEQSLQDAHARVRQGEAEVLAAELGVLLEGVWDSLTPAQQELARELREGWEGQPEEFLGLIQDALALT